MAYTTTVHARSLFTFSLLCHQTLIPIRTSAVFLRLSIQFSPPNETRLGQTRWEFRNTARLFSLRAEFDVRPCTATRSRSDDGLGSSKPRFSCWTSHSDESILSNTDQRVRWKNEFRTRQTTLGLARARNKKPAVTDGRRFFFSSFVALWITRVTRKSHVMPPARV